MPRPANSVRGFCENNPIVSCLLKITGPNLAALALAKNREVQHGAALALAIAGNSSQAQTLTNDRGSSFPEDSSVRFNYLPSVRAFLALNHGDPAKAIERSNFSRFPLPINWPSRAALKHSNGFLRGPVSHSMRVARRTWPRAKALRPPRNFIKFWISGSSSCHAG